MIFNSIEFLLFALAFFLLWPLCRKQNLPRWIFITSASFFFYAWWDWRFLFLIIGSGLVDYFAAFGMTKSKKWKKSLLVFSLLANLGSLSVFKYSKFFATLVDDVALRFGAETHLIDHIPEFALIVPVGISFYTFQSLSYTIDVYRGRLKPTRNILHFFSYLSMFPQLVAGPIVRAKDMLKQLERYKTPNVLEKWNAVKLIVFGLFQKTVIADNLSFFIDSAFQGKTPFDGTAFWWVVTIAFAFQIYTDFSGYSLIARGIAKLMGYHFKMNFNHPYLSKSLREFWGKWHISLSTWFRDYVYIPLGGSQKGMWMGFLALFITMFLSGLWHGANYTYLMWALIHIVFLQLERSTKWTTKLAGSAYILIPLIFIQVCIAWVYFRAVNIKQGNEIVYKLFCFTDMNVGFFKSYFDNLIYLILAIAIEIVVYIKLRKPKLKHWYLAKGIDVYTIALAIVCIIFLRGEGQQFIYFQF
ncbi:MAG: D-alanyl-lipoteichoic acid acyltransferase DltB (MBOAT superfamily) [Flavobacteriales bacterium]|jgi:alginate O-acetyltransferase complex protein AlgI